MALKASIDIGTNSTRLLIVDDVADELTPLQHHERLTRLGMGFDVHGHLSREAMQGVVETVVQYREIVAEQKISDIRLFATSATRDAKNRDEFIQMLKETTGLNCRVLSGEEEARLTYLGAISDLESPHQCLVCDVGGGSSEFIFEKRHHLDYKSLDIGSSRLTRNELKSDPPTPAELNKARSVVSMQLKGIDASPSSIVALGGSAATLAMMDAGIPYEKSDRVHHYIIEMKNLEHLIEQMATKPIVSRRWPGLHPQRADVILGGALIFSEILRRFEQRDMIVSLRDAMFGIFLE